MLSLTRFQTSLVTLLFLSNLVLSIPPQTSVEMGILKPLEESNQTEENLGFNATLHLYPDVVRSSIQAAQRACASNLPHNTINLAPETCLSGDYQLSENLVISALPRCSNGQTPAMIVYDRQGCIGNLAFHTKSPDGIPLNKCLFPDSSKQWSIIFRCSIWPTLIEGAENHQIAVPPPNPEDPRQTGKDKREDGIVYRHHNSYCQLGQDTKPVIVPVDKCIQTSGYSLQISKSGVCANGNRAKLARFSDSNCDTPLLKHTLIDVIDSELDSCLETGIEGTYNGKINSVAFWCEGFETLVKHPSHGQIYTDLSPPACKDEPFIYTPPKTVPIDSCVEVPGYNIQINRQAICPDGTRAKFAMFADAACEIARPDGNDMYSGVGFLRDIGDEDIGTCLTGESWIQSTFWKTHSMAFWCKGLGNFKRPDASSEVPCTKSDCPAFKFEEYEHSNLNLYIDGHQGCDGSNHRRLNADKENSLCPLEPGTLTLEGCMTNQREKLIHSPPNLCLHTRNKYEGSNYGRNLMILNPGKCSNGSHPLLAKYSTYECEDDPLETIELTADMMSKCLDMWDTQSVALLCDGPVVDPNPYPKFDYYTYSYSPAEWKGIPTVFIVLSSITGGMICLVLVIWIVVYTPIPEKIKGIFKRKRGVIAI